MRTLIIPSSNYLSYYQALKSFLLDLYSFDYLCYALSVFDVEAHQYYAASEEFHFEPE